MDWKVVEADLSDADHASGVLELIDGYARGPGGQSAPLTDEARGALAPGLLAHPNAFALLAFAGERAVGTAVCVWGFSTFAGRPTVNVHDLAVDPPGEHDPAEAVHAVPSSVASSEILLSSRWSSNCVEVT